MAAIDLSSISSILVISLSNIGDTVLTTPVISLLRERFPESSITVVAGPKGISLFQNCGTVNEAMIYDKTSSWLKQIAFVIQLRKRKFDLVIDLRNTAIPFLIAPAYRTSLFVNRSALSMRQRHLDRLRFLFPVDSVENRFHFFTEQEQETALGKLEQRLGFWTGESFIVIAPGAGSDLKQWTVEGFAQLANHFLQENRFVVLVGDERGVNLSLGLERKLAKPVGNLTGQLSLRELAGLLDHASLVVANDSAVMHLAYELDRPTVAIFGPTDERKYGQVGVNRRTVRLHLDCTPCEQAQCRLGYRACLNDLPVSSVIQASEELLSRAYH